LTSIAAADGLSVSQLAAANGLSETAQLVTGTGIQIPPQGGGGTSASTPSASATTSSAAGSLDGDGDTDGDVAGTSSSASAAPAGGGSYVVQPGDTLTAIAARAGMSVAQLAADNGLNPLGVLPSGAVLNLGGGGTASAPPTSSNVATAQPVAAAAQGSPTSPPYPTTQTVSPSEVGSIASANGVPPALAQAIAYQESGFSNNEVSSSDARGVMQILPGTWSYIQQNLTPGASPLAPASATDNVRGGVELLHLLLNATGGNAALAAAGYYQGLPSVQANGMYPSTQQYVNDVLSLQQQFNGGG
jgi:LysM repeat protein